MVLSITALKEKMDVTYLYNDSEVTVHNILEIIKRDNIKIVNVTTYEKDTIVLRASILYRDEHQFLVYLKHAGISKIPFEL